jgi:type I restriction enzyme S subunit
MKRHQLARAGQVILSEIWGKKGAIGFVPPEGDGALCTSHFFLFDVRTDRVYPKWLQAIFDASYLQGQLDAEAKGTTGYAAVRPKILFACEIPLPPLAAQRRVVTRIEALAARIQEARDLKQHVKGEMEGLVASVLNHLRFQVTAKNVPIAACSRMSTGTTPPSERTDYYGGPIQWFTPGDLGEWKELERSTRTLSGVAVAEHKARIFEPGTVLLVAIGASLGKVGLTRKSCSANQQITGIKFCRDVLPDYGYWWLKRLSRDFAAAAPQATLPIINQSRIGVFEIVIPPLPEQRRIAAYLDDLQEKADALKRLQAETSAELDALMPSILDKAFRGEL